MTDYKKVLNDLNKKYYRNQIEKKTESLSVCTEIDSNIDYYMQKAISFLDLTTLEGNDTYDKVRTLCQKALSPSQSLPEINCAAVCIYPKFIRTVKKSLENSGIKTATVATAFPSGQVPLELKLKEVEYCVNEGADEIDMVISRGELLSGNYEFVYKEIFEVNRLCKNRVSAPVHLKVILETGELLTPANIHLASLIAIDAGADFIKTSTGKINTAATLPAAYVMLNVIKECHENTGKKIGFKPAGGIKKSEDAFKYMSLVKNLLGDMWLSPELFRIGASSLLDDLLNGLGSK